MTDSAMPRRRRLRHWATVAGDDLLLPIRSRPATATASAPTSPADDEARSAVEELADLEARARACTACPLHRERTQAVFADGDPAARIMFVGEAPGRDEDRQGKPFVGRAGQLLTDIIEKAMGMPREAVYIANVVKCRPPANRNPEPEEQRACGHFLQAQIRLVAPELILTLGKIATQYLIDTNQSISRLRGRVHDHEGIPVVPTWHPAYLLRNPAAKRDTWADVMLALRTLGLPERPPPFQR